MWVDSSDDLAVDGQIVDDRIDSRGFLESILIDSENGFLLDRQSTGRSFLKWRFYSMQMVSHRITEDRVIHDVGSPIVGPNIASPPPYQSSKTFLASRGQ